MSNSPGSKEPSPEGDTAAIYPLVDVEAVASPSTTPQLNGAEGTDNETDPSPTANITTSTPSSVRDCNSDYIQELLQTVRDTENPSDIPEEHTSILCESVDNFWQYRVLTAPTTYIPTDREFALFNYFRSSKFRDNLVAQRLVARYWDSKSGVTQEVGSELGNVDAEQSSL